MTFRLVILAAFVAIARGSYINGGHGVVQGAISGSYGGSNGNLLRGESGPGGYSSGYGYQLVPGRVFTPTVSSPVIIRSSGYGSPYPYGVRNLQSGGLANYQSNYGGRSGSSYPSGSSYTYSSSPNLRGSAYIAGYPHGGFNTGAYSNGYSSSSNLQNYVQQHIPYTTPSQINVHNNPHGSFNGLANGYNGY